MLEGIGDILDVRLQRLRGPLHLLGGGRRLGAVLGARTVRRMGASQRIVGGPHQGDLLDQVVLEGARPSRQLGALEAVLMPGRTVATGI